MVGRIFLVVLVLAAILTAGVVGIPALASRSFGRPAAWLTLPQVLQYSVSLLWADGLLSRPMDPGGQDREFEVRQGETVASICDRLEQEGLVIDGGMLRDYLIYTGKDTSLQAGTYRLSTAMSIVDVANRMQDATPTEVDFAVLPGWRIDEIGASLPTSGLSITPDEFVAAAAAPRGGYAFLAGAGTTEGFLYPNSYVLARTTTTDGLLTELLRNFALHLSLELQQGFAEQGLSVYQAVTLASIVQREAVQVEEAPLIASVYLNRLRQGMRLDADPTVQYALGFNSIQQTWWTNPLSLADLEVASPYNTYQNTGLPPAPIASPGAEALRAIAFPAASSYFFFNARCDGSGYHNFARTFEEHLANLCP